MRPLKPHVKYGDRFPRAPRQNHGAGFRHITRTARAVYRERNVLAFFQPLRQLPKSLYRTSRRTLLIRAEAQALDYLTRPLTVKIHSVEHYDSPVPPKPNRRK